VRYNFNKEAHLKSRKAGEKKKKKRKEKLIGVQMNENVE